ncbi:MAG: beta-lactamase family protein [Acidobacteria bacterium]|nr:beta-lactamase family protein [Acidobacteriota bacterium]
MRVLNRRAFLSTAIAAAAPHRDSIDTVLRDGAASRNIPAVAAVAAGPEKTLYSGAFGVRDDSGVPVRADCLFSIASMTKAITTVAALQLVEQGKLQLHQPVSRHLRQFEEVQLLEGFDSAGKPILHPARTPVTLHHLLTHTSGLCYDIWDGRMLRYNASKPAPRTGPLLFEPGTNWQYGQGLDWAGRLIEAVSGLSLEAYFQTHILQPLGMVDTSYLVPDSKFDRLVSWYLRGEAGKLVQQKREPPKPPTSFNGGGGLYSTAADYVRFLQMILRNGAAPGRARILQPKTVALMKANQIGSLSAGKMKAARPNLSADVDMQPGHTEKWTYGFLLNTDPYEGGRSAGSLAWAGFYNTYYWVDPRRKICGVILMQFLPFADKDALALLNGFERAIYSARLS